MTSPVRGPYSSVKEFFPKSKPANIVNVDDQMRIQAYDAYHDIYWNENDIYKLTMRGENQRPIYLPSARKIVEATNRFLAVDFDYVVDPNRGDPEGRGEIGQMVENLFKREKMYSKFNMMRRYGLIKGDSIYHITADDTKPEGRRISVHNLDPAQYFPIEDPDDSTRIIGAHLVDLVQDPNQKDDKTKKVCRRQTYRKTPEGKITSELALFEIGKWDDRTLDKGDIKLVKVLKPPFPLPDEITTLPIYHWKNNEIPGLLFGMSELKGIETIIRGINQSISDEDLTLVMQGLGVYTTTAGPPVNPDGSAGTWDLGPASVVEVGTDQSFSRVTGVTSVAPMIDHMKFMMGEAQSSLGVNDIAAGVVDVSIAQSGIALSLQMSPILAKNGEKEQEILSVHDHLFYDLVHMWFPAYEGVDHPDVSVGSVVGDPLPENRDSAIQEILLLQASNLITIEMAQAKLSKYGYDFDADSATKVIADAKAMASALNSDGFNNRYEQELEEDGKSGAS